MKVKRQFHPLPKRFVAVTVKDFEKIIGASAQSFCLKHDVKYKNLVRSLCRGKSMLSPGGSRKHPLYRSYKDIRKRCYYKRSANYKHYGARGIKMSGEFFYDFKAFADYMGEKPGPEYSIDRIDNNKGYERGNLRWATKRQQSLNRDFKKQISGHTNITKHKNKYRVFIKFMGKSYYFGSYESLDNALATKLLLKYKLENGFYS